MIKPLQLVLNTRFREGAKLELALDWRTSYEASSGTYGFHVHDRRLREACEALGTRIDATAPASVQVGPPEDFRAVDGKFNVLFTAWEHDTVPAPLAAPAKAADLIIVPSTFLKPVFEHATGRPVEVVHLGVDTPPYNALSLNRVKRRKRGRTFEWLWCGQPHRRKGWDIMLKAWTAFAFVGVQRGLPACRLRLKTTMFGDAGNEGVLPFDTVWPITFDTRNLPRPDYWRLLRDADAYAFPTRGEGFGLTLAEAMAAALPCIYPPTTAMTDFAVGYPCKTVEGWTESPRWGRMPCRVPQPESVAMQMVEVVLNYRRAAQVGRDAARRMKRFTWQASAQTFLSAIDKHLR